MGRQPFISHAVNGYSRYDVPESKAFSCTPGILYPVRIDFINSRDRVSIAQGIDVRSNPLAVPSFTPYTARLHRFWVPMQLYHPEMRTNSSKFDMNDVSLNWIPSSERTTTSESMEYFLGSPNSAYTNSLLFWLRILNRPYFLGDGVNNRSSVSLSDIGAYYSWANADSYLAYWDIVRNYYSYSQWGLYSIAIPAVWSFGIESGKGVWSFSKANTFFNQKYCNLSWLDAYYESQFYPSAVTTSNNTYNRFNLGVQIIQSSLTLSGSSSDGYPVSSLENLAVDMGRFPTSQMQMSVNSTNSTGLQFCDVLLRAHPMAVVPANPDRFSRLLPTGSPNDVSLTGVNTIPQLAIASRLQEYKDLLGAGGSRYSDWLETFFASRIEHVDRPKLLFSASQTVNVQVVMNQSGSNNFTGDASTPPLGQQGGAIAFNTRLGRRQSYYFREPGYMIDMLSIRPVYFWSGVRPDYLSYTGGDYFNPIYNDIGYQGVLDINLGFASNSGLDVANEPCFNEFRSSYDEVLGQLSAAGGTVGKLPLYSYWVQQRSASVSYLSGPTRIYYPFLFVDMATVSSPFFSGREDNFFVNLSYSVQKKNLVNKTFATRLSNR